VFKQPPSQQRNPRLGPINPHFVKDSGEKDNKENPRLESWSNNDPQDPLDVNPN